VTPIVTEPLPAQRAQAPPPRRIAQESQQIQVDKGLCSPRSSGVQPSGSVDDFPKTDF
jgi:hypothetical protein